MIYAINHYAYSSQLTISQAANFFHQFVVTLSADEATTQLGIPTATFNTLKSLDDKLDGLREPYPASRTTLL